MPRKREPGAKGPKSWSDFLAATRERPPHRLVLELDAHLPAMGHAIDLGCGAGRTTMHLLARGWRVTAVDAEAEALEIVRSRAGRRRTLKLVQSRFEELELGRFDAYLALFTLFFMAPPDLAAFWKRLRAAMPPGSLFAGQLLGPNDDWVGDGCTGVSRDALDRMLAGMEVLRLEEEDQDGPTAVGPSKHWHLFHVIARAQPLAEDAPQIKGGGRRRPR